MCKRSIFQISFLVYTTLHGSQNPDPNPVKIFRIRNPGMNMYRYMKIPIPTVPTDLGQDGVDPLQLLYRPVVCDADELGVNDG